MLMMYIHVYLCFTHKWWRMNCCWWIVDGIMSDWCCCCHEVLLLMIHTLGVHNYRFVVWIELLRVLRKWVELMNCVEMIFGFMFDVFLKALLSTWTCKQLLETDWDVGGSKFGFWGEKWFKPVKNCTELMAVQLSEPEASCKRTTTGSSSLKRTILRSSEMLFDSIPCFAFLCLFHPFLFWIGLWCKHESSR